MLVSTPSLSKFLEPSPFFIFGSSITFRDLGKISSPILFFKNEVPLEIAPADIALDKTFKIPFEIFLSNTIPIFSLFIFLGSNFFTVFAAALSPIFLGLIKSEKCLLVVKS